MSTPHETIEDVSAFIHTMAKTIAEDWYRQAVRNPATPFYLYWRTAIEGELSSIPLAATDDDAPDGWVRGMQISGAWNVLQAKMQIAKYLYRLPILRGSRIWCGHPFYKDGEAHSICSLAKDHAGYCLPNHDLV